MEFIEKFNNLAFAWFFAHVVEIIAVYFLGMIGVYVYASTRHLENISRSLSRIADHLENGDP